MGRTPEHYYDRERGVDHKRAETEEPDEYRPPVSDPLGQQVPGCMKDGSRQNQRQCEESHRTDPPLIAIIAFQLSQACTFACQHAARLSQPACKHFTIRK